MRRRRFQLVDLETFPVMTIERSLSTENATTLILAKWVELSERSFARKGGGAASLVESAVGLLPAVARGLDCEAAEFFFQAGPRWTAATGNPLIPANGETLSLVGDAIEATGDRSSPAFSRGRLHAVAVFRGDGDSPGGDYSGPGVLVVRSRQNGRSPSGSELAGVSAVLAVLMRTALTIESTLDEVQHLRRLLDYSVCWSAIESTDELLQAIAGAATEMLAAERASIFLWDKRRGKLVGRPALGVEGGKLEVDDNAGIVGAVLGSGQPQTWNAGDDAESEVNRSVDRKLKFVTRSLVAVPMKTSAGQIVGVFEVINKRGGTGQGDVTTGFNAGDISRLVGLARHATPALLGAQTRQRLTQTRDRLLSDAASTYQVIGQSPAIVNLRETIARVAPTELAVLVLGENGTGKEVIARSLHFQSQRRDQPFVAVNCAALVESLLESELFGHERGAFTDAHQARPGKFELANGGTLFLDEIGDMSPGGQAKLLRVLEEKIVVRVGGSAPIPVDVRIIAATNQSLPELVVQKRFREDLFFRLNVVSLRLPPLRQRGDDILLLAEHFLRQFAAQIGRQQPVFSDAAARAMVAYGWPGNVRELRNIMERVSYLAQSNLLTEGDLGLGPTDPAAGFFSAASLSSSAPGPTPAAGSGDGHAGRGFSLALDQTLADATRDFQIERIRASIQTQRGNMTAAAESLGLHRSNLYRKMRQLGMNTESLENEHGLPARN
jgi:transcriptional regulator with GAF, ATPase, and Fis domain